MCKPKASPGFPTTLYVRCATIAFHLPAVRQVKTWYITPYGGQFDNVVMF